MPTSTIFRPPVAVGALYGALVAAAALLVSAGLLFKGITMDVGFAQMGPLLGSVGFLMLGLLYGYWSWGCGSMRYVVDRNALSIRWGGLQQIIPIRNIERLVPAAEGETVNVEGVNWVGHHVGRAEVEDFGDVLFYSAHRTMAEVLYVYTPSQTYAISVEDPVSFAQAVQTNQARGPLFDERQALHRGGISAQTFWQDRQALVMAGLLLVAFFAVLGYVLDTYPGLSQTVALRFPSFGGIVRLSDKSSLLDIPYSGAGFVAVNLFFAIVLHTWERMVSYVLLVSGVVIQVVLLVAAIVAVA